METVRNEKRDRTEIRMLRLLYAIRLRDRITDADIQNILGLESINDVLRSLLHSFGLWDVNRRMSGRNNFDISADG